MDKPRILIFGQPFNDLTGGGITLSNLFRGWPPDRIAVAATGHFLYYATTDICNTYYQLGEEEHKWVFPFNIVQRRFPSGLKVFAHVSGVPGNQFISSSRYRFVNHFFYPLLGWFGLLHRATRLQLSGRFREWLATYRPDILYLQVHSYETIRFARELISYLKIPAAIHFMDDWPSTISNRGPLKHYWKRKIDSALHELINMCELRLSISDAMSAEYERRYRQQFTAFHNPVDLSAWLPHSKTDTAIGTDRVIMLYSGRIGTGIASSIVEVAEAIDELNRTGMDIELRIQTPTEEVNILNMLKKYGCVIINPLAEYSQLPAIFSGADLLLLANDFDSHGVEYLRYSMPTKASEYMISGTPILVYAPGDSAVLQIFRKNECGFCLSSRGREAIMEALTFLINNPDYRSFISRNAVNFAKESFDAARVRSHFQSSLTNLLSVR